ncbi:hypothetical protein M3J07_010853 [Ascochyta lentis]
MPLGPSFCRSPLLHLDEFTSNGYITPIVHQHKRLPKPSPCPRRSEPYSPTDLHLH